MRYSFGRTAAAKLRTKKKPHMSVTVVELKLTARVSLLKTKGITDTQIQRDATVKHFKGKIRQAKHQLACIADLKEKAVRPLRESG